MSKRQTRKSEMKARKKARAMAKRSKTPAEPATHSEISSETTETFFALRGKAIQEYDLLEQALCLLLGTLARTSKERAAIIFFKITNTDARITILNLLLTQLHNVGECCGDANAPCLFRKSPQKATAGFWGSFVDLVRTIDKRRNEIVHWIATINQDWDLDINQDKPREWVLMPSDTFGWDKDTPSLDAKAIRVFMDECRFLADVCHRFRFVLDAPSDWTDAKRKTWLEIFQQPIVYPLPPDHPLSRALQTRDSPPPPSQE
jgi:hypothetical protein